VEGGTDGWLTTEAAMAKRKEIAASIRQDAEQLGTTGGPLPRMLRLMESLEYEKDGETARKVEELAGQYVAGLKELSREALEQKKDEVRNVSGTFRFLARWSILPRDFPPAGAINELIRAQGWDKRRRQ
jgi:hypothetical protein